MKRIFLTGMSGVGKSTIISLLRSPDTACIDLDDAGWMLQRESDHEPLIDLPRVRAWLARHDDQHAIISGCAVNQGQLRDVIDAYVLLTAPTEVMHQRILARSNNRFGQEDADWQKICADKAAFEPLLRAAADVVIDTDRSIEAVLEMIRRLL